jgi:hypothetical protein
MRRREFIMPVRRFHRFRSDPCLKSAGRSYVEVLLKYRLTEDPAMATGNVPSLVDSSTVRSHNYSRVPFNIIGRSLVFLLSYLRIVSHPWWELGDYLLADIGKTPGDAEVEKLRHRPVMRDPRELAAPGASCGLDA